MVNEAADAVENYADFEKENVHMHIKDWTDFNLAEMEKQFQIK